VQEINLALVSFLHASILVDRNNATMAESLFEATQKVVVKAFGEKSLQYLQTKIGLGRCYQQQSKTYLAERAYAEAVEIAREVLGPVSPITYDVISNMHFMKLFLNTKPNEQAKAAGVITEEVMPFYSEAFGVAHPYTVHTRGRIGLFMNKAKKDSGRKIIFDALKIFDRYKQFPFTYDHPWVLELGGFESKPNAKERLSHSVEEFALASWSMPSYEGDKSFGTIPKQIWIDLKNLAEEAWGSVHFYGVEKGAVDQAGGATGGAQPTPFARLRLSKNVAKRVLPAVVSAITATLPRETVAQSHDAPVDQGLSAAAEEALKEEVRLHLQSQ
jgi:hypothetical protein